MEPMVFPCFFWSFFDQLEIETRWTEQVSDSESAFFTINIIDGLVSLESKFVTSKFVGELYPGVNVENDVEN